MHTLAARLPTLFGVTPTGRYARYLATGEWAALDGRFARLPTYKAALALTASGPAFDALLADPGDAPLGGADAWVPLATLGRDEPQFLVIRATDDAGPVAMFEHETGRFVAVAATLDAFIDSTGATKGKARAPVPVATAGLPLPALWKLIEQALEAADQAQARIREGAALTDHDRAALIALLAKLEPQLPTLPSRAAVADTDYHLVPGHAHYARGKLLRALGRFEEACAALDGPLIDGKRAAVASDMVCEIWFADLDRPRAVVDFVRAAATPSPAMQRMAALALVRLGEPDAAVAELDAMIARRIDATLKLQPQLGRAGAVAKQRDAVTAFATTYAARHGIAAEVAAVLARVTFA